MSREVRRTSSCHSRLEIGENKLRREASGGENTSKNIKDDDMPTPRNERKCKNTQDSDMLGMKVGVSRTEKRSMWGKRHVTTFQCPKVKCVHLATLGLRLIGIIQTTLNLWKSNFYVRFAIGKH